MNIEEAISKEVINKVREAVKKMLEDLNYPDDFRKDRLLTEITNEISLSYM